MSAIQLEAIGGAIAFVTATGLKMKRFERAGETAGVLFHLLLIPIVAALPAPEWVRASGYGWLVIDTIIGVAALNALDEKTVWSLRLGGHVLAGLWIVISSIQGSGAFYWIGIGLGTLLGGYSFVAVWIPRRYLFPTRLLMIAWLLVIAAR